MIKLRIQSIDEDGFNGRDYPPSKTDIGLLVTPLAMFSYYAENGEFVLSMDGGMAAYPERGEPNLVVWTALTPDGRTLELVEHEVIVGLT